MTHKYLLKDEALTRPGDRITLTTWDETRHGVVVSRGCCKNVIFFDDINGEEHVYFGAFHQVPTFIALQITDQERQERRRQGYVAALQRAINTELSGTTIDTLIALIHEHTTVCSGVVSDVIEGLKDNLRSKEILEEKINHG